MEIGVQYGPLMAGIEDVDSFKDFARCFALSLQGLSFSLLDWPSMSV